MKTLKISTFILIAFLFVVGCNDVDEPHIKKNVTYPDLISPIYYIDTFQIESPRITFLDSVPYIFSLKELEQFENEDDFIKRKGVIRYLTPDMHSDRHIGYLGVYEISKKDKSLQSLVYSDSYYWNDVLLPIENIKGMPIYKFVFEPETFLLTIISKEFNTDMQVLSIEGNCSFVPAFFSKDFILAINPIFSKRNWEKINKLSYRRIYGKKYHDERHIRRGWTTI